jgi:hypothetical protein
VDLQVVPDDAGVVDRHERLAGAEQAGPDADPFRLAGYVVEEEALGVADLVAVGAPDRMVQHGRDLFSGDHRDPPCAGLPARPTLANFAKGAN